MHLLIATVSRYLSIYIDILFASLLWVGIKNFLPKNTCIYLYILSTCTDKPKAQIVLCYYLFDWCIIIIISKMQQLLAHSKHTYRYIFGYNFTLLCHVHMPKYI